MGVRGTLPRCSILGDVRRVIGLPGVFQSEGELAGMAIDVEEKGR